VLGYPLGAPDHLKQFHPLNQKCAVRCSFAPRALAQPQKQLHPTRQLRALSIGLTSPAQFRPARTGPAPKTASPFAPKLCPPISPAFSAHAHWAFRPFPAPPAFSPHLQYHSGIPRRRPRLDTTPVYRHPAASPALPLHPPPAARRRSTSFARPGRPSSALRPLRPPAAPRPQLRPPPNAQLRRRP
jgi:hypothetical protein